MTKTELLNTVIKMTRDTGQGIPYFIKYQSPELGHLLDELTEEGLIVYSEVRYDDGWWTAANCYNVWKDGRGNDLTFLRTYLGIDDLGLGFKLKDVLSNLDMMKNYVSFLEKNETELVKLKNLKEVEEKYEVLTDEILEYFLDLRCVKDNETVSDVKKSINKRLELTEKMIDLHSQIIEITKNSDKHIDELNKTTREKEACETEVKYLKGILTFLAGRKEDDLIKTIL